ncbi:SGNH/GDSL hydrolase family protein [Streptomyces sp. NPDC002755]|uniref:SGNH/GDSL hydrolase family protein n=1 Tax=Streptomyces sp. NPDC002884 TaxID=3154544 RepID=UPI00331D2DE8
MQSAGVATALLTGALVPMGASATAATPTLATTAEYVALGDSYASGAGLSEQTNAACDRSQRGYPGVVADSLKASAFRNVSCSGATTAQMTQAQGSNPAQLNALSSTTTLVTLSIGGNDIGFSSILTTCVISASSNPTGAPCRTYYQASGTDQLETRIAATKPKVAAVLAAIKQRSPKAKVVVVGYPSIVPDDGAKCRPSVPIADQDVPYLRDTTKKVNTMLADTAKAANATYANTYTPTVGHDMCRSSAARLIEPLTSSTGAPAHPNATGQFVMSLPVIEPFINKN